MSKCRRIIGRALGYFAPIMLLSQLYVFLFLVKFRHLFFFNYKVWIETILDKMELSSNLRVNSSTCRQQILQYCRFQLFCFIQFSEKLTQIDMILAKHATNMTAVVLKEFSMQNDQFHPQLQYCHLKNCLCVLRWQKFINQKRMVKIVLLFYNTI